MPPTLKFDTRINNHGEPSAQTPPQTEPSDNTHASLNDSYYGIGFLAELRQLISGQTQETEIDWMDNHLKLKFAAQSTGGFESISQLTVIVSRDFRRASVYPHLQAASLESLSLKHELQLIEIPLTIDLNNELKTREIPVKIYQLKESPLSTFSGQLRYDLSDPHLLQESKHLNNPVLNSVVQTVLSYLSNRYGHSHVDTAKDHPDWSLAALVNAFWRVRPDMSDKFVKFVPIVESPLLAQWVGASSVIITDQSEQTQKNFKPLGAHNFLKYYMERGIDPARTAVVAASHGNHAQGVVLAAQNLGYKETLLVLPLNEQTSKVKIRACLGKYALIMLHGSNLFHAMNRAKAIEAEGLKAVLADETVEYLSASATDEQINGAIARGHTVLMYGDPTDTRQNVNDVAARFDYFSEKSLFVPTYDQPQISMGQGVDMMDLLARVPSLLQGAWHYVFPLGGMGKGTGDGTVLKHLNPAVKIEGISSDQVPAAKRSLQKGKWDVKKSEVTAPENEHPKYADGTDVPDIGKVTFKQYAKLGGGVQTVSEDEIGEALVFAATYDWYHGEAKIIEGAPASVLAALLNGAVKVFPGEKLVLSITGKNVDDATLIRAVQDHGWVGEHQKLYRIVTRFRTYLRETFGENAGLLIEVLNKLLKTESFVNRMVMQYQGHKASDLSVLQNAFLEAIPQYRYDPRFRDLMTDDVKATIDFFARTRLEMQTRRNTGLNEYAAEIAGEDYAKTWGDEFKVWLAANRYEARRDGNLQRLAYVYLRGKELEKKGFTYNADVIKGKPDESGNPINLHVELTVKSSVDPKGVVVLMTGYGESTVQYQQIIEQFASEGFAVVTYDYRGHGLSDSPKGIPGYMDSAQALLGDTQKVIAWSERQGLKNLRRFAFGFSQGALIQLNLQTYEVGKKPFDAFSVVSPTIALGKRYVEKPGDVTNPLLEILPLDTRTGEWNVASQSIHYETQQGRHFNKWLNRGFVSPYYLRRPSVKIWKTLIAELSHPLIRRITQPVLAFMGDRDPIIGNPDVLDARLTSIVGTKNTNLATKYLPKRGHFLLLDKEGQNEQIVKDTVRAFNEVVDEFQNWINLGVKLATRKLVDRDVFNKRIGRYFKFEGLWCEARQFVEGILNGDVRPNSNFQLNTLSFYLLGRLGVTKRAKIFGKSDQVFEDEIAEKDDSLASDDLVAESQPGTTSTDSQPQGVSSVLATTIVSGGLVPPILSPLLPR